MVMNIVLHTFFLFQDQFLELVRGVSNFPVNFKIAFFFYKLSIQEASLEALTEQFSF